MQARTMITFEEHGTKFTFRVAGIAIHHERILFQYADGPNPFWFLPGGRAELGETAEQALQREIQEELGLQAHIVRLLYVVENFFTNAGGTHHHEIGFYFLLTLPEERAANLYQQTGRFAWEKGEEYLQWAWLPIEQLPDLPVYPEFLRTALATLPDHPIHIVAKD